MCGLLSCCCSVAVGLLLGVLLVLLVRPPAGFSKHVIVTTGLGEHGAVQQLPGHKSQQQLPGHAPARHCPSSIICWPQPHAGSAKLHAGAVVLSTAIVKHVALMVLCCCCACMCLQETLATCHWCWSLHSCAAQAAPCLQDRCGGQMRWSAVQSMNMQALSGLTVQLLGPAHDLHQQQLDGWASCACCHIC